MIPLADIYSELILQFASALKQRSSVDKNFIDNETIKSVIYEMRDNLQNKDDLLNKLRFREKKIMPNYISSGSQQSQDELQMPANKTGDGEKEEEDQNQEKKASQKEIEQERKRLKWLKRKKDRQWRQQYKKQKKLTDNKSATLHISATYNIKTKKYISSKDQEQITMPFFIIKSEKDQQLFTGVSTKITKGDKNEALQLCLKQEKSKPVEKYTERQLKAIGQQILSYMGIKP